MDYPKTDDDWVRRAECIVTKQMGVLPEAIGSLTVEATATIFSWYRGEERSNALSRRADARHDLIEYGRRAGCLEEREELKMRGKMIEVPLGREEQHYWEVTNMATGEILQKITPYRTIAEAVNEAQFSMDTEYSYFKGNHLVIKIFDKSPDERAGLTFEPEYTESYWIEGAQKQVSETIRRPLYAEPASRPFPKTYGDWVDLGESIKEKAGINDFETMAVVNNMLFNIHEEDQDPIGAQDAKRWLTEKAQEMGIR